MDDDWDLHAVVRGCATNATTTAPAAVAATNNPFPFHDEQDTFDFSVDDCRMNDPFQGLHEIYQEFCGGGGGHPPATSAAPADAMPFPPAPAPQQDLMQIKPPLQLNMQIPENVQFNHTFPAAIPQPVRPRRRKNQQTKMVRTMTQEELAADSWAWRKYGQKPIKGSPYPRNYYRCSTSKGCAARKQVERSPNDPEVFVVSYSGEHTHPRPTHRSSLAGSTRTKLASKGGSRSGVLSQKGSMASSSSSPAAGASFSPATPTIEGEAADAQMAEDDEENNPSDLMNEDDDMFRGFQDSDDHSSGGDFFSSGLMTSPPWTPTSSAGAGFNG